MHARGALKSKRGGRRELHPGGIGLRLTEERVLACRRREQCEGWMEPRPGGVLEVWNHLSQLRAASDRGNLSATTMGVEWGGASNQRRSATADGAPNRRR